MAYIATKPITSSIRATIDYTINPEKTAKERAEEFGQDKDIVDTEKVLGVVFDYAARPDKITTEEKQLYATGINCSVETAFDEFLTVQKAFGKDSGRRGYHGWQSFPPDLDIEPELVHKMGVEFAEKFWGERFQVVVTTHLDQAHLHNHFVINSVSFLDGKKYVDNKNTIIKMRQLSDEICVKYGLPVINNPYLLYGSRSGSSGKLRAEQRGAPTWRGLIKMDIDDAISISGDFEEFKRRMIKKGYLLKFGKHFAVSPPDFYKNGHRAYIRLRSLKDDDYTLEGIRRRVSHNALYARKTLRIVKVRAARPRRKLPYYMSVYYRYMYSLGLMHRKPNRVNWAQAKQGIQQAQQLNDKIKYIKNHNILTPSDIEERLYFLNERISVLEKERKRLYNSKYRSIDEDPTTIRAQSSELHELKRERYILNSIKIVPTTKTNRDLLNAAPKNISKVVTAEDKREKGEKKV